MRLFNRAPVVIDNSTGERVDDGEHRGGKGGGRGGNTGRHRRAYQCNYTWSTRPAGNAARPGAHYDHACVNAPSKSRNDGQCGTTHVCRTWECGETHD